MKAHVLSTGDELLLGDIIDSNAAFLCRFLLDSGIRVEKTMALGDDPDIIATHLLQVSKTADICLVTGGLGPTQDDVTALAAARAAGVGLVLDPEALDRVKAFFKARDLGWTRENEKQAFFPKGAGILDNPFGTAPGFYRRINQCLFFFMPGPPSEMRPMAQEQVLPVLQDRFGLAADLMVERVSVFMLKESVLGKKLEAFDSLFSDIILGIRVLFPVIEVKIRFREQPLDRSVARDRIRAAKTWIVVQLGDKVISEDGLSLAGQVGRILEQRGLTLAVAESCTGGLIANMITDLPGASAWFLLSAVTYANHAKTSVLGVDPAILETHGAVAEQTAAQMAEGARRAVDADFAIATTGIAGPTGGTDTKPVGMVCIGLAGRDFVRSRTLVFKFNDRDKNKKMFAASALDMLRRQLVSG